MPRADAYDALASGDIADDDEFLIWDTSVGQVKNTTFEALHHALEIHHKWKESVACATTANITLSGEQTIDGVLTSASRVLVKDQSTGSQNGLYDTAAGAWTRTSDADSGSELVSAVVAVTGGTVNADILYRCTNDAITLGTTAIVWSPIVSAAMDPVVTAATLADGRDALQLARYVLPEMYGAVGNGVTEDAAAVQDMFDDLGEGDVVVFSSGKTYKISDQCTLSTSGVTLDLRGATINAADFYANDQATYAVDSAAAWPTGLFHIVGPAGVTTTIASNAADRAVELELTSAAGVAVGDAIHLLGVAAAETWYYEQATKVRKSHVSKISAISGATITIEDPLPFALDVGVAAVNIESWTGVQDITVLGGTFLGPGYVEIRQSAIGEAAIRTLRAQNVNIVGTKTVGFQGCGIHHVLVHGGSVFAEVHGVPDDYTDPIVIDSGNDGFSGLFLYQCGGFVLGVRGYRNRHMIDGTRSYGVIVSDSIAHECHRAAFSSHTGCQGWVFNGCRYSGPNGGLLWRGFDMIVNGCDFTCPNDSEPALYDTTGDDEGLGRTILINGGRYEGGREGIRLSGNIRKAIITGADVIGGRESTSYDALVVDTLDLDHLEINGGAVENISGGDGIVISGSARTRRSIRIRTRIKGYGASFNAITVVGESTVFDAEGCILDPSAGGATHIGSSGTFAVLRRGPSIDVEGAGYYDPDLSTWTPTITFATPGDLNVVYTTQVGHNRKRGREVTVWGNILTSTFTHTTASGDFRIALPFTMNMGTGQIARGCMTFQRITKANYTQFAPGVLNGSSTMNIICSGSGQNAAVLQAADMPTGGAVALTFSLTYWAVE